MKGHGSFKVFELPGKRQRQTIQAFHVKARGRIYTFNVDVQMRLTS
jgi:hypothetical protein